MEHMTTEESLVLRGSQLLQMQKVARAMQAERDQALAEVQRLQEELAWLDGHLEGKVATKATREFIEEDTAEATRLLAICDLLDKVEWLTARVAELEAELSAIRKPFGLDMSMWCSLCEGNSPTPRELTCIRGGLLKLYYMLIDETNRHEISRDTLSYERDEALAEVERLKTWKRRAATVRHELESENQCLREQLRASRP